MLPLLLRIIRKQTFRDFCMTMRPSPPIAASFEETMKALLVAALLPGLYVAGMVGQKPATNASAAVKPLTLKQLWTIDATYRDVQHEVNFGYHPPALSNSDIAKPIAGFGYDEDGVGASRARIASPYTPTSLEGFGIVYAAVAAESAAGCEAKASEISGHSEHGTVLLGGRSFSVHKTFSGGMSQFMDGKLYTAFVVSTCYLFETSIAGSFLGSGDGVQPVAPAQLAFIESHLLDIMKSVRIGPGRKMGGP